MANKILLQTAAGIGVLAVAWLGASAYLGSKAEHDLAAQVQKTAADCNLRLSNLQQQSGLFSGNGKLEVHVGDLCNNNASEKYWVVADVDYNINHLILPSAVMRFNWTLRQRPEPNTVGPMLQLNGTGGADFSGFVYSDLNSVELSGQTDDGDWRLEPVAGHLASKGNTLDLTLQAPRFTARGGGSALELQGVGLQVHLLDRELGLGQSAFTIDKISTASGSAERLSFSSETMQNGDRIDAKMLSALGGMTVQDYSAQDLAIEIALKGVYADSIRTLATLAKETKSLKNLTLEENKRYRAALKQVVNQGFSTGITKLSGTVSNAAEKSALTGQMMIDIKPNTNPQGDVALAKVLQSSGQVTLSGNALDEAQKSQLLQMGIARATPDGLQAAYDYSAGILKTNDRIIDDQQVQQTLVSADSEINQFLNETAVDSQQPGLENVIAPATEDEAGQDMAQNAAAPDSSPAETLQSVSLSGRVSYADANSVIEDPSGQRLQFVADSEIGRLIASQCAEGESCVVSALIDGQRQIKAIQQLSALPNAAMEASPPPATMPAAETEANPANAVQPSFDCAKAATVVEKLICTNSELAAADALLAARFKEALAQATDGKPLLEEQRHWIKTVRNACSDVPCLAAVYQARIGQLSQ